VTDPIDLCVGVLQGDTLAPYLFVIVMDYVMRKSADSVPDCGFELFKPRSARVRPDLTQFTHLTDLAFADDIALLSGGLNVGLNASLEKAQRLLDLVETEALKVGLSINKNKTEYMVITSSNATETESSIHLRLKSGEIKRVDDFKYLGSQLISSEKDLKHRKKLAWMACLKLKKIWLSKTLSRDMKLKIFQSIVEPVLLYGAQTWSMTETLNDTLDGCYTRLLRYAFSIRVTKDNHVFNKDLFGELDPVSVRLKRLRLRFAGHCHRSESTAHQPVSQLMFWTPSSPMCQPTRILFPKLLKKDVFGSLSGEMTEAEIKTKMKNRVEWRKFCDSLTAQSHDKRKKKQRK
jgi:hypothetical protein